MKIQRHEIKKPEDLTGKCPQCGAELDIRQGEGLCYCSICQIKYNFYVKSLKE